MPAQSNATVELVTGQGTAEDWDTAAAGGAQKWAGQARAYYREANDRRTVNGATTIVTRRELILDRADVAAMALDTDDVISFRLDAGGELLEGKASTIPRLELAGVPRALQTSRIVLEDT